LEALASQIAAAWLDGGMTDDELQDFIACSFESRMSALLNMIDSTVRVSACRPQQSTSSDEGNSKGDASAGFSAAVAGTKRLIAPQRWRSSPPGLGECVIAVLVASMVLRQCGEQCLTTSPARTTFRAGSTNVAPEFFARCMDALGRCPFGAGDGVLLSELATRIGKH
jgi:hypothetical protein